MFTASCQTSGIDNLSKYHPYNQLLHLICAVITSVFQALIFYQYLWAIIGNNTDFYSSESFFGGGAKYMTNSPVINLNSSKFMLHRAYPQHSSRPRPAPRSKACPGQPQAHYQHIITTPLANWFCVPTSHTGCAFSKFQKNS